MSTPAFKIAPPAPGPSAFTDRTPPYSAEAEMAVLGGMLIDQDAVVRAVELVDDSMFHREAHRRLFRSLLRIWQRGDVIDEITVTDDLKKAGDYEGVGGVAFLASLLDAVPTAANIEYHCKIVREKAILRRLIEASTSIIQETYAWQGEVENLMDLAESRIFQLAQSSDRRGFVWIKEILWPTFEKIEQLQANQSAITGVPSGFHDLDELTAGFQSSDLVIVAARPSMGKCLAHDSEIVLEDGSVATIEELYRRRSARLLTLNDGWKLEMTEPSAFVDDGEKPVFRVTTRLGRQIETTLTHPFLTIGGWKRLEEIRVGDHVAVPRRIGVFGDQEMRDCEVKLLAYLIGDGGLTNAAPRLASAGDAVRGDWIAAVDELVSAPTPVGVVSGGQGMLQMATGCGKTFSGLSALAKLWSGGSISEELGELVLGSAASGEASIPAGAFRLRRGSVALLLNRLFALHAYGIATADGPQIVFQAASERVGRQVQHLLLRFEVLARYAAGDGCRVVISDPRSLRRFASEIGLFGHEAELGDLVGALDEGVRNDAARGDVYWDEVVAIEPVGVKQVYDLTIPGTHNFVANDICVHNTAFTLNIAQHAAISAQKPVAFFSLEMSKESLVQRVLCAEARVDASRLRRGRLTDDDYARLAIAAGHLNTAPIYIDDTPGISVLEMRAKARRLKSDRDDLSMIIVDYLQLMVGAGKTESRQQEVSEISRGLKALAKELDIPVIALSQLSRAVESRPDKRPMMSDLRECVTGDTLVVLADGRRVPIRDLVGTTPEVVAMSPDGELIRAESDLVWSVGVRPVRKITLESGKSIRCTGLHRLFGRDGWVRAEDLHAGDELRIVATPAMVGAHVENRYAQTAESWTVGAYDHESFAPGHELPDLATLELVWDRIAEIAPDGEEEVFDLTVPGPASWLADGIVSHNSGAIEQDADVIMFLYRPEYYFGPVDKEGNSIEGKAELIIGKQRNGATGSVPLFFRKEFTLFESMSTGRGED